MICRVVVSAVGLGRFFVLGERVTVSFDPTKSGEISRNFPFFSLNEPVRRRKISL